MGVTILPDMVYRPWSLEGLRVESVTLASEVPTMDVGIAWAYDAELQPPASAFVDFLLASASGARLLG